MVEDDCLLAIKNKINYSGGSLHIRVIEYFKEEFGVNITTNNNINSNKVTLIIDGKVIFRWDYSEEYNKSYIDLFNFINTLERSLKINSLLGSQNE